MLTSAWPAGLAALSAAGVAAAALATAAAPATTSVPDAGPPVASLRAAAATRAGWVWPVQPTAVLRGFDAVGRYEAGHRGVDLAATAGQVVVAVAAGSVTFAGQVAGRGVVVVAHPDGSRTTYEPVVASAAAGTPLAAGDPLGTLAGTAHCATGCLHLGLREGDRYLDPLLRLRGAAPVLLPMGRP